LCAEGTVFGSGDDYNGYDDGDDGWDDDNGHYDDDHLNGDDADQHRGLWLSLHVLARVGL